MAALLRAMTFLGLGMVPLGTVLWDYIEVPLLQFILLGRVPGTAIVLDFYEILLAVFCIMLGVLLAVFWRRSQRYGAHDELDLIAL